MSTLNGALMHHAKNANFDGSVVVGTTGLENGRSTPAVYREKLARIIESDDSEVLRSVPERPNLYSSNGNIDFLKPHLDYKEEDETYLLSADGLVRVNCGEYSSLVNEGYR